jgi:hypothetical protein
MGKSHDIKDRLAAMLLKGNLKAISRLLQDDIFQDVFENVGLFCATVYLIRYSNSQGGSTQVQTVDQQQIGQPKLGSKKCVSDTTINHYKCRGFSTGPKGNCGTEPTLLPPQS